MGYIHRPYKNVHTKTDRLPRRALVTQERRLPLRGGRAMGANGPNVIGFVRRCGPFISEEIVCCRRVGAACGQLQCNYYTRFGFVLDFHEKYMYRIRIVLTHIMHTQTQKHKITLCGCFVRLCGRAREGVSAGVKGVSTAYSIDCACCAAIRLNTICNAVSNTFAGAVGHLSHDCKVDSACYAIHILEIGIYLQLDY